MFDSSAITSYLDFGEPMEFNNWETLCDYLWQERQDAVEALLDELSYSDEFKRGYTKGLIDAHEDLVRLIRNRLKHGSLVDVVEGANESDSSVQIVA